MRSSNWENVGNTKRILFKSPNPNVDSKLTHPLVLHTEIVLHAAAKGQGAETLEPPPGQEVNSQVRGSRLLAGLGWAGLAVLLLGPRLCSLAWLVVVVVAVAAGRGSS